MDQLKFGQVVLLRFPFTDGISFKRRPALIIHESDDGDVIVCRITSKIYQSDFDIEINNLEKSGLKLPSVIWVHKIATLEKKLVELKIGQIGAGLKGRVRNAIKSLAD
ncbi:MAG: type II toxin-antitoxin system PemK/MazF family toxin [Bacteroidota bacterium]|nr:growth inhibitor [Odoribacter sp.]MDP3642293.1 type II toxin-antitoxin system PemK/MazF family toxin [Bacteroidota bacterium]